MDNPSRLKQKDVKSTRFKLLEQQGRLCAICHFECTDEQAVLDHYHKGGHVRAVLHRGCNALFGRVENNAPRHGLRGEQLIQFLLGAAQYLKDHEVNQTGLLHPTHRTPEEKAARAKKRAKKKRLLAKQQVT